MMQTYLAVMAGGALGTGVRMYLSMWMAGHYGESFPWGTILVNVTGCFIIGLFSGLTGPDGYFVTSPLMRLIVMVGFLGGYTTFSSFSLQTLALLSEGRWSAAGANVCLSLIFCLVATWGGLLLAGCFQPAKI